jgi:phage shock protein E
MKNTFYIVLCTLAFITCNAQTKKAAQLVAPAAFAQKMAAEKGQVIDVRTPKEYQSGHIENAVNMHVYDKDFEQRVEKLDKTKPVYVYCKAGGRSAEAVEIMEKKGFKKIVELDGGMDAWLEAGKPVKK